MKRPTPCLALVGLLLFLGAGTCRACDATAPAACASKPCCCEKKCKCDPCKCESASADGPTLGGALVGQLVGLFLREVVGEGCVQTDAPDATLPSPECLVRPPQYVPLSLSCELASQDCASASAGPGGMPEPLPLPMPIACQPGLPCGMPMQMTGGPFPGPKQYAVKVRLLGHGCGKGEPCATVKVYEGEGAEITYARAGNANAKPTAQTIQMSVRHGSPGQALVHLKEGTPGQLFVSQHKVALDRPTRLKLPCPPGAREPRLAEVMVHEMAQFASAPCCPPGMICGPYGCPMQAMPPMMAQTVPGMPMPYGSAPPMMPSMHLIALPATSAVAKSSAEFLLVKHEGKSRVEMKSGDGRCVRVLRMEMQAPGAGPFKLCAGKKQLHVSGRQWKATADSACMGADGKLVLTGHVKLVSANVGVCASVKAERVCVQLRDGRVEMVLDKKAN